MNHQLQCIIKKPFDEVVRFFDNKDNYELWMEGLQSYEVIEKNFGEKGAVSILKFDLKGREIELKETVLKNDLPQHYEVEYDTKGMKNRVEYRFTKHKGNSTELITINSFEFSGFMKFFSFLMKGALKKQSQKYMDDFKKAVEND